MQFKRPGFTGNGYIQFSYPGSVDSKKGLLDATRDENTVTFGPFQERKFERIKGYIDKYRDSLVRPGRPGKTGQASLTAA